MRTQIFIFLSLLILQLIGCTRAAQDVSAKVSIALPSTLGNSTSSVGALATLQLAHVSINATGVGIAAPIVSSWDSCHDCATPTEAPTSFQVEIPSGTGRLVQVLAVYKDVDTKQMVFFYGDKTADLIGAELALDIDILQVGQGSITSGRVSGRYLTTATEGPTGLIDIKYTPSSSKPALIIEQASIVNGWFSLFMLSGANLQYVLRETNELLWGQEMSFESAAMDPAENSGAYFDQRVRTFLPVNIRVNNNNSTITYNKQEAETFVWGYWGPGAVGKKVCTSGLDSSPVAQKLKGYVPTNFADAPSLSVTHLTSYTSAVPTKAVLTDTTTPYSTIVVQGGSSMSTTCGSFEDTVANQYSNFQKVTLDLFDGNGGDNVAGFRGIFRSTSPQSFMDISSADPRVLSGHVLPGVETVFSGLHLFKRLSTEELHLEAPNCTEIAKGAQGFVEGTITEASINSAGLFTLASNISSSDATAGVSAVICPITTSSLFSSGSLSPFGFFLGKWTFSNMGNGNVGNNQPVSAGPPTQIVVSKNSGPINIAPKHQCFDISVDLRDGNGSPASSLTATNFLLTPNSTSGVSFYSTYNDCMAYSNPLDSSNLNLVIPPNQTSLSVYIKSNTAYPTFQISPSSGSLTAVTLNLLIPDSGNYIKLELPQSMVPSLCYTGKAVYSYYMGGSTPAPSDITVNLTSSANLGFFSDAACSTATSTTAINTGASDATIYVKVTGSPSGALDVTATATGLLDATYKFYQGSGTSSATGINIQGPNSPYIGSCSGPYEVNLINANSTIVPAGSSKTITFNSTLAASFWSDSSCSSSAGSMVLPLGAHKIVVWTKFNSAGSTTFSAASTGLSPANYPVAVSGLQKFNLALFGGGTSASHGQCLQLEIQPVNYPLNDIGGFPYGPLTLNFVNFPTNSLFKSRINSECVGALGTSLSLPSFAVSPQYVYFLATNGSASPLSLTGTNMHIDATNYASGAALNLSLSAPPSLALADANSGNAAVEFPFQIFDIIQRFSGIPSFSPRYYNGSSWVNSAQTTLSNSVVTNTDITDGAVSSVTYNVTGRAATWIADFTTGTLPTQFTLARSSSGYEVQSTGYLLLKSTNTPRWDRDPDPASGGYPIRGLLVEGATTNLLGSANISEDFSLWNLDTGGYAQVEHSSGSITDLFGGTSSISKLTDSNQGNGANVQRASVVFTNDIADNQEFVASVFIKKETSRYAGLMLNSNGGMSGGVVIDLDTGTTAPTTGPYTPQNVLASGAIKHNNGWYRVWVKFNSNYATHGSLFLFPAFCDSATATLCTDGFIAATGTVSVWGAQVEQSSSLTSYIPTSIGTRSAENLTIDLSYVTSFNASAGTFRTEFANSGQSAGKTILIAGNASESVEIYGDSADGEINGRLVASSSNQGVATATLPFITNGSPNIASFSYNTGANVNFNLGLNGLGSSSGNLTSVAAPSLSGLSLQVGGRSDLPTSYLNGSIKTLHYWPNTFGVPGVRSSSK